MARYLVTGGAGFIGSHLCDALVDGGHDVVVLDDFSSGHRANLAQLEGRVEIVEGDLTAASLDRTGGKFDTVVHLAALISGHDSLLEPDAYCATNIFGLLRVIDFVAANKIPRIVFASSSTVYGNSDAEALSERDVPAPITVYAANKLNGEHLLAMYGALHGFSHCSLRLFNVYGPRQAIDHPYANVTCKFSHAAANRLPIALYGDGEQSRDFVYIDDVVRAFMRVLATSPSAVYNIGTGAQTSINGLIATLEGISGNPFSIDRKGEWPNDIRRISADLGRAEMELGYRPTVDMAEGLARTVASFSAA